MKEIRVALVFLTLSHISFPAAGSPDYSAATFFFKLAHIFTYRRWKDEGDGLIASLLYNDGTSHCNTLCKDENRSFLKFMRSFHDNGLSEKFLHKLTGEQRKNLAANNRFFKDMKVKLKSMEPYMDAWSHLQYVQADGYPSQEIIIDTYLKLKKLSDNPKSSLKYTDLELSDRSISGVIQVLNLTRTRVIEYVEKNDYTLEGIIRVADSTRIYEKSLEQEQIPSERPAPKPLTGEIEAGDNKSEAANIKIKVYRSWQSGHFHEPPLSRTLNIPPMASPEEVPE